MTSSQPYTVRLRNYAALPQRDRTIAEVRFSSTLESMLGGRQAVMQGFEAFCANAGDHAECPVSPEAWNWSVQMARATGLRGMPMRGDCFFEIVPDQGRAETQGGQEVHAEAQPPDKKPVEARPDLVRT